nr:protein BREVIS RADIX-like [Tanacetum cinerariifolium]
MLVSGVVHSIKEKIEGKCYDGLRNNSRSKDGDSHIDVECVKQDEPGVYITLRSLPKGTNDLKRVRFRPTYKTVGAVGMEFKLRIVFIKKVDSMINVKDIRDVHKEDGAKILELSNYSINHQPLIIQQDLNLKLISDELMIEQRNELFKAMQSMFEEYRQCEQAANLSNHTPEPLRRFNSICYDDNDDDDDEERTIHLRDIISQLPPSIVITTSPPVLPIEDLEDSLIMKNKELSAANISTHTPEPSQHFNSICYDDEERTILLRDIISQLPPSIVITTSPPILPIEDLKDSLIMGNEDLNTILEKESDEVIKSSVEDLV